jgi:hypothetical protein
MLKLKRSAFMLHDDMEGPTADRLLKFAEQGENANVITALDGRGSPKLVHQVTFEILVQVVATIERD